MESENRFPDGFDFAGQAAKAKKERGESLTGDERDALLRLQVARQIKTLEEYEADPRQQMFIEDEEQSVRRVLAEEAEAAAERAVDEYERFRDSR